MSYKIPFTVWDTSANAGKTGDGANLTLDLEVDGSSETPGTITEEGNGQYSISIDDGDLPAGSQWNLNGSSATADVVVIPTGGIRPDTMRGTDSANTTTPPDSTAIQTAAAAALTAYDPPTRTEATADKDEVIAASGGAVTVGPVAAVIGAASVAASTAGGTVRPLSMTQSTAMAVPWVLTDANGDALDVNGDTFELIVFDDDNAVIADLAGGQFATSESGATPGTEDTVTATISVANSATAGYYHYVLRDITLDALIGRGRFTISEAPTTP